MAKGMNRVNGEYCGKFKEKLSIFNIIYIYCKSIILEIRNTRRRFESNIAYNRDFVSC